MMLACEQKQSWTATFNNGAIEQMNSSELAEAVEAHNAMSSVRVLYLEKLRNYSSGCSIASFDP